MLRRKFTKKQKLASLAASSIIASIFFISYNISVAAGVTWPININQAFALAILMAVLPPSILDLADIRWKTNADENLPKLVVDVNGYVRSGQNIVKALELAAERNYGVLTPELQRFKAQLSWGVPIDRALMNLSERVGTPLGRRVFSLFLHVIRSGGKINEVLDVMVKHVAELRLIERERKASLRPYLFTTYIAFLVFLATSVLLFNSFFAQLAATQMAEEGPFRISLNIELVRNVFYQLSIIEATIGGIVAGKLGEGTMGSGVKHVIILIFITMLVFSTLVH